MAELLELVFNVITGLLEIVFEAFFGSFEWPDTKVSRIILSIVIAFLGVLIWWELR